MGLRVLDIILINVMCYYNWSISRKKYLTTAGSFEKIPYNRFEESYIPFSSKNRTVQTLQCDTEIYTTHKR